MLYHRVFSFPSFLAAMSFFIEFLLILDGRDPVGVSRPTTKPNSQDPTRAVDGHGSLPIVFVFFHRISSLEKKLRNKEFDLGVEETIRNPVLAISIEI